MAKQINWNKQSALAGWANFALAIAIPIGMVLWSRHETPSLSDPPSMTPWIIVASLYLVGIVVAGLLHWKAASMSSARERSEAKNTAQQVAASNSLPKPAQPAHPDASEILKTAPEILIDYSRTGDTETLAFTNDGATAAANIGIDPLTWTEKRFIRLSHALPAIPSKNRHVSQIYFFATPNSGMALYDFMRKMKQEDVNTTVDAYWTDASGHRRFSRTFTLTTFGDGSLVWNPGPIKLLGQ